jgi:hypothetical protein
MLKYADYVEKKTQIFLYPCDVTVNILSKYLVGLDYRKFQFRTLCWSSYEDEVLYQILLGKNCLKFKQTDQVTL